MDRGLQTERATTVQDQVYASNYISRDLSWIQFNRRVLDQVANPDKNLFDRLKFLSITSSNLDEFCTIRLGSLYNYLDLEKNAMTTAVFAKSHFVNYCWMR